MLEIKNITKSFGGVAALGWSDFTVRAGQVTALIGPNGAGKTTLFDIISGFLTPDSGTVVFKEQTITTWPAVARAQAGLSRTFQQPRLFRYLTILDHLRLSESRSDISFGRGFFDPPSANPEPYEAVLREFGIERGLDAAASELSYDQRKLLQLALAVRRPHQLLMLDEPVAGVNTVVQEKIERLLLKLKEQGETMLLIDHDMGFVRRLADQVICLDAGVVIVDGPPETVLNDQRVLEAYLGV